MDQARTLRKLLGQAQAVIHPILGDLNSPYVGRLAQQVLLQHAAQGDNSLLFDAAPPLTPRYDLIDFFQGRRSLEDLVHSLDEHRHVVPATKGLSALMMHPAEAPALLNKLHRLPVTTDKLYATLSARAWELACRFAPADDWLWLVSPTSQSVTDTFQAIRRACGICQQAQHRIIVVGGRNADEADHVYASLLDTTLGFLGKPLQYCGHIPSPQAHAALQRVARNVCALESVAVD